MEALLKFYANCHPCVFSMASITSQLHQCFITTAEGAAIQYSSTRIKIKANMAIGGPSIHWLDDLPGFSHNVKCVQEWFYFEKTDNEGYLVLKADLINVSNIHNQQILLSLVANGIQAFQLCGPSHETQQQPIRERADYRDMATGKPPRLHPSRPCHVRIGKESEQKNQKTKRTRLASFLLFTLYLTWPGNIFRRFRVEILLLVAHVTSHTTRSGAKTVKSASAVMCVCGPKHFLNRFGFLKSLLSGCQSFFGDLHWDCIHSVSQRIKRKKKKKNPVWAHKRDCAPINCYCSASSIHGINCGRRFSQTKSNKIEKIRGEKKAQ